jgi:hypothetical protein
MSPCSPGTHARQLALSRQRVLDTPALLDRDVRAATYVAAGLAAANITWRQRQLPPHITLWAFLLQVLSADGACREAVTRVRTMRVARGQAPPSPNTGSYCKARLRLPEAVMARPAKASGHMSDDNTSVAKPTFTVDSAWGGRTISCDGKSRCARHGSMWPPMRRCPSSCKCASCGCESPAQGFARGCALW